MISFIIPAYNEEYLLGRMLDALHHAAGIVDEPYEIIVADDNSSDKTGEVALGHGATVIRVDNRQIAATRNAGARIARGERFIFVDADTIVSPDVLREALTALRNGAAGGGAAIRFDGYVPLYGRIIQWLVYRVYRWGKIASGSFMFCTRTAFETIGGFNEQLYASEEADMSRALRRCGPFIVLRQTVLTSGRKLRLYSFREIMGIILRVALSGGKITDRHTAHIWYDPRREFGTEDNRN
jgi:glycosyltransferase involved in cell wall biosynthesis